MRLGRRTRRERNYLKTRGDCSHAWRTRYLTPALSGATCEVCERCGALHVAESEEAGAHAATARTVTALRPAEGTALPSPA
jgi:hypothetical protein